MNEVLELALTHIAADLDSWDQTNWGRRTDGRATYCLAGHVMLVTGWQPVWAQSLRWERAGYAVVPAWGTPHAAMVALGWTTAQANAAFYHALGSHRAAIRKNGQDPLIAFAAFAVYVRGVDARR